MTTQSKAGLEDVVAVRSAICDIDGTAGRLSYRGYDIGDLAENASFEETIYLLWHGELPASSQLAALRGGLQRSYTLPPSVLEAMLQFQRETHPLHVLQAVLALLAQHDADVDDLATAANERKALRLVAQTGTAVAAWARIRRGLAPVPPRADLGLAANFLYMLHGQELRQIDVQALDKALVLHADHELNASTFVVRVAAATETDLHSAIVAAAGTLKGPKHGGANEDVIEMLQEIGDPAHAREWIRGKLARRAAMSPEERRSHTARIPGFGHRVYKVDDPRARHLREMSMRMGESGGDPRWSEIQEIIREEVQGALGLPLNVDYYSAAVYYALGIPPDMNTSVFAVSRMAGWTAHYMEQLSDNRLIRPRAEYTGPTGRRLQPLEARAPAAQAN